MDKALDLKAVMFEAIIGEALRTSFLSSLVIYNQKIPCCFLKRKETQVDVILITEHAVYVIEAKGWKNLIKGTYADYMWRGISGNPIGMTVFNPIYQNLLHIRLLKTALRKKGINKVPLINIVCVQDGCHIESNCRELMHFTELVPRVQYFESLYKDIYINKILVTKTIRSIRV